MCEAIMHVGNSETVLVYCVTKMRSNLNIPGGTVVSTVAAEQEDPEFNSLMRPGSFFLNNILHKIYLEVSVLCFMSI